MQSLDRSKKIKSNLLYLVCIFLIQTVENIFAAESVLTIGLMVSWTGKWDEGKNIAGAAVMAVNDINNNRTLLPGKKLELLIKDDACKAITSIGATEAFHNRRVNDKGKDKRVGVDVYVGPYCSDGCVPSGLLAAYYKEPMISYSCSSKELSNKLLYPTFARTATFARTSEEQLTKSLAALMREFKWTKVTLIVSSQPGWHPAGQYVFEQLRNDRQGKENLQVQDKLTFTKDMDMNDIGKILEKAQRNARSKYKFLF